MGDTERDEPGQTNDPIDPESIHRCDKCGATFAFKNGSKHGMVTLCGYCEAVIYGESNSRWLPSLGKAERLPKGYRFL